MGRLVALVMVVLLTLLIWQAVDGGTSGWVSAVSLIGSGLAIVLALTRVVPNAVRLGARLDPPPTRSALARGMLRDHVVFLALIVAVLVVQLVAG